jgi:hypothetical protein
MVLYLFGHLQNLFCCKKKAIFNTLALSPYYLWPLFRFCTGSFSYFRFSVCLLFVCFQTEGLVNTNLPRIDWNNTRLVFVLTSKEKRKRRSVELRILSMSLCFRTPEKGTCKVFQNFFSCCRFPTLHPAVSSSSVLFGNHFLMSRNPYRTGIVQCLANQHELEKTPTNGDTFKKSILGEEQPHVPNLNWDGFSIQDDTYCPNMPYVVWEWPFTWSHLQVCNFCVCVCVCVVLGFELMALGC